MRDLDAKLAEVDVNVDFDFDPVELFRRLHDVIGEEATVLDRYELEARSRGVEVAAISRDERDQLTIEVLAVRGFEQLGMPSGAPVVVVPYDPAWSGLFHWRRGVLKAALGATAVAIEHMGSTAVPGLAAKPIVDIVVSVPDVSDEASYVGPLEETGLEFRSRDDAHRYFRPPASMPRDIQVHVADSSTDWRRSHLLFRDYLRTHDEVAAEYGALKQQLATEHANDRMAYTDMKGSFIRDALVDAEEWASKTGWKP